MFKKTGQLVSLSEQNLVDCSWSYGTYGCSGAWMANAYDYVINHGLQATKTYPYTSVVSGLYSVIMPFARWLFHINYSVLLNDLFIKKKSKIFLKHKALCPWQSFPNKHEVLFSSQ